MFFNFISYYRLYVGRCFYNRGKVLYCSDTKVCNTCYRLGGYAIENKQKKTEILFIFLYIYDISDYIILK